MRRWLLAIGTLLAGSALSSYADYVVIRVNLGMARDKSEEEKAAENQPGGPGFPGNRGPGGQTGLGFGGAAPGGFGGGGFRGTGIQGGGAGALGLGARPPGAPGGALGGQAPGFGQLGGGAPPGRGGAFTSQQTTTDEEDEKEVNPLIVTAVIEVDHSHLKSFKNTSGQYHIAHKWGETQIYYAPAPELIVTIHPTQTVAQRFYIKRRLIKDDASPSDKIEQFLELATWSLEHGALDQVDAMMDEVAKLDPKNATLATFQKLQADMNREVTQDDPALEEWRRDRLGDFNATNSKHYALLNDLKTPSDAQRWLDRLEQNYRGFFYWFALRGQALPVPKYRLVAVMLKDQESFTRGREIFDEVPYADDGFFAPRERLAVFAASRLDAGYVALDKLTRNEFLKEYSVSDLFQKKPKQKGHAPNTVARGQTWVLLLKAMEEDAQRAAVTHEGTKQLLSAVGFWPRNVAVPEWLNYGIGSFFETPRGSYWPGVGAPNAVHLANFQRWEADKDKKSKFEHDSRIALKAVVTDKYFRDIRAAREKDKDALPGTANAAKGSEVEDEARRERDLEYARARCLTWAFTYYLMKQPQHRPGMMRYIEELKKMPRDMEFDEETLLSLFGRAFGLMDRADPNKIDENKMAILGSECYEFVRREPLPWKDDENDGTKRETKPSPGKRGQKTSP